ncbi:MAG: Sec-independent protein translocase subunit TatA [Nocardioidaceae bacterium]|nr:Sec-independent protein translocase subunit TatA [Nocardioidaceae bacterium]
MGSLGPTEIILIVLVIVLLFGAKKLPELARGSGRALRIFKAETKGLVDDDEETKTDPHGRPLPPGTQQGPVGPNARPEPSREPVQDGNPRDQA